MTELDVRRKNLLENVKTLAIVCNQWGDTGKGKFVDYFTDWAEIIARGTGGANAGHTIRFKEKEYIFHLLPCGILYDNDGKINIIGSGVAFDPAVILKEIQILESENISYKNLKFSKNAKLVLPQHIVLDRLKESGTKSGSGIKIGTTGRGIGPVYVDHYNRSGLVVNDLQNIDIFKEKFTKNLEEKMFFFKQFDRETIKSILHHDQAGGGKFWDETNFFNVEKIVEEYGMYGKKFSEMIDDTDSYLRKEKGKKNILLEGAQGNLLSVDIGTYPFVTSSDCSASGLAKGVGLSDKDIDLTLGIVKAPYMTRVGEGPFPTELGGIKSAEWCKTKGISKESEKNVFPNVNVDDTDELKQGVAIRILGGEYGATTGRPRRVGWLDLPLLSYSSNWSGKNTILTKVDVLDTATTIRICYAYEYNDPDYKNGSLSLKKGDILKVAIMDNEIISNCKPIYKDFPGWKSSTSKIKSFDKLPENLKNIIAFIESETSTKTRIISVGADREETIIV